MIYKAGETIIAKKSSSSFEESIAIAVEVLKKILRRNKTNTISNRKQKQISST